MSSHLDAAYDLAALPYRIAVICYLYDDTGRLLMLHRRKAPNIDMYSPIGGKVEVSRGESPHECAAREVREEAGIDAQPQHLRLQGMVSERAYQGEHHWLLFCFEYCRAVAPSEITHMEFEEGRLEWVPIGAVAQMSIPVTDRDVLWPLVCSHRGGFFAVDIDCSSTPLTSVVRESRQASPPAHI